MPPRAPESLLVTLLRQYYTTPGCLRSSNLGAFSSITQKRYLHVNTSTQPLLNRHSADHSKKNTVQNGNGNASRAYATSTADAKTANEIAILGGGITGLATAYFLTKQLPDAKVTIYEASDHLGGWLRTKRVMVGNGTILFEQGPRTLRPGTPAGMVTLEMVSSYISIHSI